MKDCEDLDKRATKIKEKSKRCLNMSEDALKQENDLSQNANKGNKTNNDLEKEIKFLNNIIENLSNGPPRVLISQSLLGHRIFRRG